MRRARGGHRRGRMLGIGLLILGLLHVPLPQPDYHNVRHHDAPGEVCEHHDHLLRWHPGAGSARDVAVLHWHWISPESGPIDRDGPGRGVAIHAHVIGWDAPTVEAGPPVVNEGPGRALDLAPPALDFAAILAVLDDVAARDRSPARGFGATFAPRASQSLLQRWAC